MKLHARNSKKMYASLLGGLLLLVIGGVTGCHETSVLAASNPTQQTFAAPEEAGQALQAAARTGDENALEQVLGVDSKAILSSGDQEEDKAAVASFVAKYDRMNRWVTMTDGSRILYIGADNYPYPVPLMQDASSRWYFDSAAGKDEILARRIGKNELLAIDATYAMANAEELYHKHRHDDDKVHQYTLKILSTPGKQDGLYWEVRPTQPSSPLGRLNDFAKDVVESTKPGAPPIFDGYSFRVLTAQGENAKGGAKSYLVDGDMTDGFAIIATPVTYGDSGIMTFILSRQGVVYQKDLGPKTTEIADSIYSYNPDNGWTPAE
jgi:hypothetical protein